MLRRSIISIAGGVTLGMVLPVAWQTQRVMRVGHLKDFPHASLPAASLNSAEERKKWRDGFKRLFGWEDGRNLIWE